MTEEATGAQRRKAMQDIEQKHFGRCLDQIWGTGRRSLIELMQMKSCGELAVVVKMFDRAVPKSGTNWPELMAVYVYVPIEDQTNTWVGLDEALTKYRSERMK